MRLTAALQLLYCCFTARIAGKTQKDLSEMPADSPALLLPYSCFTAALPHLSEMPADSPALSFTVAVQLLYCCFTAALLLLYCCFTAALLLASRAKMRAELPALISLQADRVAAAVKQQ
jgi:hypothetical protein